MKIAYIVDGASSGNGLSAAFGIVVKDAVSGEMIDTYAEHIGEKSNNEAEYSAIIKALEMALKFCSVDGGESVEEILVLSDSNLIVSQVKGDYAVKAAGLRPYWQKVKDLIAQFPERTVVTIDQVPREYTHEADALARAEADKGREKEIENKYPFLSKQ